MATAAVGNLRVNLTAHTAKFQAGMRKAGGVVAKFKTGVGKAKAMLGSFGGILGAVTVGGLVAFVKRSADAYDALGKFSDRLHINVEELQRLRHVADLTGAGADTLNAGLETLAKRLGEASRGTGAATAALKELGLSAKTLSAMSPDRAFMRIARAMEAIEEPGKRAAIVANLFSKANMSLLGTIDQGTDAIRNMGKELGNVLGREQIAKIERFNDQMTTLGNTMKGVGGEAAGMFAAGVGTSQLGLVKMQRAFAASGASRLFKSKQENVYYIKELDRIIKEMENPPRPQRRRRHLGVAPAAGGQAAAGLSPVDAFRQRLAMWTAQAQAANFGSMWKKLGAGLASGLARAVPRGLGTSGGFGRAQTAQAMLYGSPAAASLEANTQVPMLNAAKERNNLLRKILQALDFEVADVDREEGR
jgi:hypothetical protein